MDTSQGCFNPGFPLNRQAKNFTHINECMLHGHYFSLVTESLAGCYSEKSRKAWIEGNAQRVPPKVLLGINRHLNDVHLMVPNQTSILL